MKKQTKNKTWRKVKLGELGEIITGKTPSTADPQNFGGAYPFVTIPDLKEQRYIIKTERTLSEKGAAIMKNLKLPANSVMLSCLATVGETGITTKESFTNQQINSVICDKKKVVPEFLYYTFKHLKLRLLKYSGSVYTNISKSKFAEIEIKIPEDISEQKHIASILSAFDDKIELNNKINQTLEQMAQAIFKEWFVKNQKFSKESPWFPTGQAKIKNQKLGDLVDVKYGQGPASSKLNKKSGYPVYGANGVIGYFDSYNFSDRQIIVGCRGVVGNVTLTLPQCLVTHNSLVITPRNNKQIFFYYLLRNQNLDAVVGGSAQPQITIRDLEQLELLMPDERLQDKFESVVGNIEQKRLMTFYENEKLAELRDLLLPKLMSGEIRV